MIAGGRIGPVELQAFGKAEGITDPKGLEEFVELAKGTVDLMVDACKSKWIPISGTKPQKFKEATPIQQGACIELNQSEIWDQVARVKYQYEPYKYTPAGFTTPQQVDLSHFFKRLIVGTFGGTSFITYGEGDAEIGQVVTLKQLLEWDAKTILKKYPPKASAAEKDFNAEVEGKLNTAGGVGFEGEANISGTLYKTYKKDEFKAGDWKFGVAAHPVVELAGVEGSYTGQQALAKGKFFVQGTQPGWMVNALKASAAYKFSDQLTIDGGAGIVARFPYAYSGLGGEAGLEWKPLQPFKDSKGEEKDYLILSAKLVAGFAQGLVDGGFGTGGLLKGVLNIPSFLNGTTIEAQGLASVGSLGVEAANAKPDRLDLKVKVSAKPLHGSHTLGLEGRYHVAGAPDKPVASWSALNVTNNLKLGSWIFDLNYSYLDGKPAGGNVTVTPTCSPFESGACGVPVTLGQSSHMAELMGGYKLGALTLKLGAQMLVPGNIIQSSGESATTDQVFHWGIVSAAALEL